MRIRYILIIPSLIGFLIASTRIQIVKNALNDVIPSIGEITNLINLFNNQSKPNIVLYFGELIVQIIHLIGNLFESSDDSYLVPNFAEPIAKGSTTAIELMKVVNKYELGEETPTAWITNHRLAMQDLQVNVEFSIITTKQQIISSISKLTEASSVCENKIRATYGSFRSLHDTIIACSVKIMRNLENIKANPYDPSAVKNLIALYQNIMEEMGSELTSIIKEVESSLFCIAKLKALNIDVYRYILQEDNIAKSNLDEVQARWSTYFGYNKKLIEDLNKTLKLLQNLDNERVAHNTEVEKAYGNLKVFESYLEKTRNKLYHEKFDMEFLRNQLKVIKETVMGLKNPQINKSSNSN